MKRAAIILTIALLSIFMGCSQNLKDSHYPDCLKHETNAFLMRGGCECFSFFIHLSKTRAVSIDFNSNQIDDSKCTSFDLANVPIDEVSVVLYSYANHRDSTYQEVNFCNSRIFPTISNGKVHKWEATKGKVTVAVNRENIPPCGTESYLGSVVLENVEFINNETGADTLIDKIVIKDVAVGHYVP